MAKFIKALIIVCLIVIIITGVVIACSQYTPNKPIEISIPPEPELQGEIYVGGAVNNPGLYPLRADDKIADIIQAAGGISREVDFIHLQFHIPEHGATETPQKIDINRAEVWLFQALPGIGEVRAQAIVDYRRQNGPFRSNSELIKVPGIGTTTYENIKSLITISDQVF